MPYWQASHSRSWSISFFSRDIVGSQRSFLHCYSSITSTFALLDETQTYHRLTRYINHGWWIIPFHVCIPYKDAISRVAGVHYCLLKAVPLIGFIYSSHHWVLMCSAALTACMSSLCIGIYIKRSYLVSVLQATTRPSCQFECAVSHTCMDSARQLTTALSQFST